MANRSGLDLRPHADLSGQVGARLAGIERRAGGSRSRTGIRDGNVCSV